MSAAAPTAPLSLTLELDPAAEPIAGSLRDGGSLPRPFVGWLGLLAALDAVLTRDPDVRAEEV